MSSMRFKRTDKVVVTKGNPETHRVGEVVTVNEAEWSYGVRIEGVSPDGRAIIVECPGHEVSAFFESDRYRPETPSGKAARA